MNLKVFVFIGDIIYLLYLVLLDHIRLVPRKNTINLLRDYWNVYIDNKLDILEIYHNIVLIIKNVSRIEPRAQFISYEIENINFNKGSIPYLHYIRFDCLHHVYFFTMRRISCVSKNSIERSLNAIDNIFNNFDYPNSTVVAITDAVTLEKLQSSSYDISDKCFDTIDLVMFKSWYTRQKNISKGTPTRIYLGCIPNPFISNSTFDWVFRKLLVKFENNVFYLDKNIMERFEKAKIDSRSSKRNLKIVERWGQLKNKFVVFENYSYSEKKYFPLEQGSNSNVYSRDSYMHIEHCVDNCGYYLCCAPAPKIYYNDSLQKYAPFPIIVLPCNFPAKHKNVIFSIFSKIKYNLKLLFFIYFE